MDNAIRLPPSVGSFVVGAYLFSVPAFAYSDALGFLFIPQFMGLGLVLFAIYDVMKDLRITIPFEVGLYGLMGLSAGLTTFLFQNVMDPDTPHLASFLKVVLATLACAQLIKSENDLLLALKLFVFSIFLVFFQNIAELRYLSVLDKIPENERFAGTLTNANLAAIYSLAVIWASVLQLSRSRSRLITKVVYLIPICIGLIIIYYSGSKKGLIGIALIALFMARPVYYLNRANRRIKYLTFGISIFILFLAAYFIYKAPFLYRIGQMISGESVSDQSRLFLAKDAVDVWLMNAKTFLFGVGYERFRFYSTLQDFAHSTPFELLASSGIIGFLLFMSFFSSIFLKYFLLYRRAEDRDTKSMAYGTLMFLSIFLVFMLGAVVHDSRELVPIIGCLASAVNMRKLT